MLVRTLVTCSEINPRTLFPEECPKSFCITLPESLKSGWTIGKTFTIRWCQVRQVFAHLNGIWGLWRPLSRLRSIYCLIACFVLGSLWTNFQQSFCQWRSELKLRPGHSTFLAILYIFYYYNMYIKKRITVYTFSVFF